MKMIKSSEDITKLSKFNKVLNSIGKSNMKSLINESRMDTLRKKSIIRRFDTLSDDTKIMITEMLLSDVDDRYMFTSISAVNERLNEYATELDLSDVMLPDINMSIINGNINNDQELIDWVEKNTSGCHHLAKVYIDVMRNHDIDVSYEAGCLTFNYSNLCWWIDFAMDVPMISNSESIVSVPCTPADLDMILSSNTETDVNKIFANFCRQLPNLSTGTLQQLHMFLYGVPSDHNNNSLIVDDILDYFSNIECTMYHLGCLNNIIQSCMENEVETIEPTIKNYGNVKALVYNLDGKKYTIKLEVLPTMDVSIDAEGTKYLYDGEDVVIDGVIIDESNDNYGIIKESLIKTKLWK